MRTCANVDFCCRLFVDTVLSKRVLFRRCRTFSAPAVKLACVKYLVYSYFGISFALSFAQYQNKYMKSGESLRQLAKVR